MTAGRCARTRTPTKVTGRERRVTRTVTGKPGQKQAPNEARDLEARLLLEVGAGQHREARAGVYA